jgi:predicted outer membrane protein
MTTVTLQYDDRNKVFNQILAVFLSVGAHIIEPQEQHISEKEKVLKAYQKMFGKRKDNQYSDDEIFIFNSKLNAANTVAKYI